MVEVTSGVKRPVSDTVWLASFPKSGNTWIRAILTVLQDEDQVFDLSRLSSGWQPFGVATALDRWVLDPRWFDGIELQSIRHGLGVSFAEPGPAAERTRLLFRKTHEVYRDGPVGREPFPVAATRGAILLVRDPRDVACSWSSYFGSDLDESVRAVCHGTDLGYPKASPADMRTEQPWGNWATHVASWLAEDVPFPVHVVRYEDLHADPVLALRPVLSELGWDVPTPDLRAACERTAFARLRAEEDASGFRESLFESGSFFRRGRIGTWRSELSQEQVHAIEEALSGPMSQFGYLREGGCATQSGGVL